ncbi:inositol monophosphatase [Umezawaea sp.]|uniref:inositol monophosphatase family protein n=1 Tax=Umezawaea sp. TaxID=1955258 RepID=UPI002ED1953C
MSDLDRQLAVARAAGRKAGHAIRSQFGRRDVVRFKGNNDVQLRADLVAQRIVLDELAHGFPSYGRVTEEEPGGAWPAAEHVWVVDPIDGSNNFGYGIAHFSTAISLVHGRDVVLTSIFDPIGGRDFSATAAHGFVPSVRVATDFSRATVSVVTNYSADGQAWTEQVTKTLASTCKRVVNLWAPSLDLALLANGSIDAVLCHRGSVLDTCGGVFLVESAGGVVLDLHGGPLAVDFDRFGDPISFVAARSADVATQLLPLLPS